MYFHIILYDSHMSRNVILSNFSSHYETQKPFLVRGTSRNRWWATYHSGAMVRPHLWYLLTCHHHIDLCGLGKFVHTSLSNANFLVVFSRSPCAEPGAFLLHLSVSTSASVDKYYRILQFLPLLWTYSSGLLISHQNARMGAILVCGPLSLLPSLKQGSVPLCSCRLSNAGISSLGFHDDFEDRSRFLRSPWIYSLFPPGLFSCHPSLLSDPPLHTSISWSFLPTSEWSSRSCNLSTLSDEQFGSILLLPSKSCR